MLQLTHRSSRVLTDSLISERQALNRERMCLESNRKLSLFRAEICNHIIKLNYQVPQQKSTGNEFDSFEQMSIKLNQSMKSDGDTYKTFFAQQREQILVLFSTQQQGRLISGLFLFARVVTCRMRWGVGWQMMRVMQMMLSCSRRRMRFH